MTALALRSRRCAQTCHLTASSRLRVPVSSRRPTKSSWSAAPKAVDVLRHAGGAPKNRSLNSLREQAFRPWDGGWYFVTFDPSIVDNEPDKQQLIDWDVRLAVRFLRTASLEPPIGTYRWVSGFSELTAAINARWAETNKPVEVALDTETMGLYPWYKDKDIVSIGFTLEAGRADCLYLGPFPDPEFPLEPAPAPFRLDNSAMR